MFAEKLFSDWSGNLSFFSRFQIKYIDAKEIKEKIISELNSDIQFLKEINKKLWIEIEEEFQELIPYFNTHKIIKEFDNLEINAIKISYIYMMLKILYKDYLLCSHIEQDDNKCIFLNKEEIHIINYRGICKDLISEIIILFKSIYTGSIDQTNLLTYFDLFIKDEFLKKSSLISKKIILFLYRKLLIKSKNIIIEVKNKTNIDCSININNDIFSTPVIITITKQNSLVTNSNIDEIIKRFMIEESKKNYMENLIQHQYNELLNKNCTLFLKIEISYLIDALSNWLPSILCLDKNLKNPAVMKVSDVILSIYNIYVDILNINKKFIITKDDFYKDLKQIFEDDKKRKQIFDSSFQKINDSKEFFLLIPELYIENCLSLGYSLSFLNDREKNIVTSETGKLIENFIQENILNNKSYKIKIFNNQINIFLKDIFEFKEKTDPMECDAFFYNEKNNKVYIVEIKHIYRKKDRDQNLESSIKLFEENGFYKKLKERTEYTKNNILKLKKYFNKINENTKVIGVFILSKDHLTDKNYWIDNEIEYFIITPSIFPAVLEIDNLHNYFSKFSEEI